MHSGGSIRLVAPAHELRTINPVKQMVAVAAVAHALDRIILRVFPYNGNIELFWHRRHH
jgi:hypothetical protein